jgi:sugar diacid utilization regulator
VLEERYVRLKEQISNLHGLFVLSMIMTQSRDTHEILSLAVTSVPSLGPCSVTGVYLTDADGKLQRFPDLAPVGAADIEAVLAALGGDHGDLSLDGAGWEFACALRSLGGHRGYLLLTAAETPTADQVFLLKVLAHQTGTALENAALHQREERSAAELRRVNAELASVNDQLAASVTGLERTATIREALTQASASGAGEAGIARTLHELTGYAAVVEDPFGNLRAWAGPGEPLPYPKPDSRRRAALLRQARREGRPLRDGARLVAVAQPRDEVLGVVALVDPEGAAGAHDAFALEHAALVLAMELAHERGLAEMELRLRGDLVDDLVAGTDEESAYSRAQAIGYDLHRPHAVVVVQGRGRATGEPLTRAVAHAAAELQVGSLVGRHAGAVVLLAHDLARWAEFGTALATRFPTGQVAAGVGGRCETPAAFPRSCREAFVALGVRQASREPAGVTTYEGLGIYRILAGGEHNAAVEGFVREWLGSLLDYDAAHRAELVKTLSCYLECGGSYDETADALAIHRSTLRYRLQRIREVSGLELADVDTRFNLHAATRAWRVLGGST